MVGVWRRRGQQRGDISSYFQPGRVFDILPVLGAGPEVDPLAVCFGLPVAGSLRGFREVGLGARFGAGLGPGR